MQPVHVLVTIPELHHRRDLLDQIADVDPSIRLTYRSHAFKEDTAPYLRGVDVLYTINVPSHLREADRLRWVSLHHAGIDHGVRDSVIFDPEHKPLLTNAAGGHAVTIAEYVLCVMTMLCRGFLRLVDNQRRHVFAPQHARTAELNGQTLGIVGYGQIGREIARPAHAHHMTVLALKNDPTVRISNGYPWKSLGDPQGVIPQRFFGPENLHEMLGQCDIVVNGLPHTAASRGFFDAGAFQAMRLGAFFISIGRGETIHVDALADAVRSGKLSGASMDCFEGEPDPLPPDSPLWDLPNFFLTPHISGSRKHPHYVERTNELFCENLRRFIAGQPLFNIVSRDRGY